MRKTVRQHRRRIVNEFATMTVEDLSFSQMGQNRPWPRGGVDDLIAGKAAWADWRYIPRTHRLTALVVGIARPT